MKVVFYVLICFLWVNFQPKQMFQMVGSYTDLPGQDSGQEGVVAGDSSNFSDSGDVWGWDQFQE